MSHHIKTTLFLFALAALVVFVAPHKAHAQGFYPAGCSDCTGAGSWCTKQGGYACGTASQCGAYKSASSYCPPGCTCSVYEGLQCAGCGGGTCNDCIRVDSCTSAPVPTTTPIPGIDDTGCPPRWHHNSCSWCTTAENCANNYFAINKRCIDGAGYCSSDTENTRACGCEPDDPDNTNVPPEGHHDINAGTVGVAGCVAAGWATDPTNRNIDIYVRVRNADTGAVIAGPVLASTYRPDLYRPNEVCDMGTCAFSIDMWPLIAHNENVNYYVEAQDFDDPTLWAKLTNSPKIMNCEDKIPNCSISTTTTNVTQGSSINLSVTGTNAKNVTIHRDKTPTGTGATAIGCWQSSYEPCTGGSQSYGLISGPENGSFTQPISMTFPEVGNYYVVCNAEKGQGITYARCTGNPYCGDSNNWWCKPSPLDPLKNYYNCNDPATNLTRTTVKPNPVCAGTGTDCIAITVRRPIGSIEAVIWNAPKEFGASEFRMDVPQIELKDENGATAESLGATKTQLAVGTHVWTNVIANKTYTISVRPPPGFVLDNITGWSNISNSPHNSFVNLLNDGETLSFNINYWFGGRSWYRTVGGDVYSGGTVGSTIGTSATPQFFNMNPPGVTLPAAGMVYYRSSYNFNLPIGFAPGAGPEKASQLNIWPIRQTLSSGVNMFGSYFQKLATHTTSNSRPASPASCTTGLCIFSTKGPFDIVNAWNVGVGQKIIILIDDTNSSSSDGNLNISSPIVVAPGGFLAFVVKRSISFDGLNSTLVTPAVTGVFVAGENITTGTNPSLVPFYGKGIFVAGSDILLKRSIDADLSFTTPSEIFQYDPNLLMAMPDEMMDLPYSWEEAAP